MRLCAEHVLSWGRGEEGRSVNVRCGWWLVYLTDNTDVYSLFVFLFPVAELQGGVQWGDSDLQAVHERHHCGQCRIAASFPSYQRSSIVHSPCPDHTSENFSHSCEMNSRQRLMTRLTAGLTCWHLWIWVKINWKLGLRNFKYLCNCFVYSIAASFSRLSSYRNGPGNGARFLSLLCLWFVLIVTPSLVPRPSPAPDFGRLQYGRNRAPFWLHFCILQAIKNWSQGRPGNEAK